MTKKTFHFLIAGSAALLLLTHPHNAEAYLVPLIGGVGWLVAALVGGIIAIATFIWVHVVKVKALLKKKRSGAAVSHREEEGK